MPRRLFSQEHRYLVRRVMLWLGLCAVLAAEVWLVESDLRGHLQGLDPHSLWPHLAVALAVLLIPLTLIAILARLPSVHSHIKRRYIIKPIRTLKSDTKYDGAAIGSLLLCALRTLQSSATGQVEKDSSSASQEVKINLPYAAFPMARLWANIRYVVLGSRDVIVEGILIQSDTNMRIRLW